MYSDDLVARKKEIRGRIRRLRDSLNVRCIDSKSSTVQAKLWRLIQEQQCESVMFYIAFGSEVRTQDCIVRAISDGRTVIVPVCVVDENRDEGARGRGGCRDLLPSRLLDFQSEVEEGTYGILEPKPEFRRPFPPEKIDLIVVPGLAFDERGYRIGYGAGYYDHFLARCPQALSVGLAYEMQILECVFPTTCDIPVHKIITEDRAISCNRA